MTEDEWLGNRLVNRQLKYTMRVAISSGRNTRRRKMRLIGCGSVRLKRVHLNDGFLLDVVEAAEKLADGEANDVNLTAIRARLSTVGEPLEGACHCSNLLEKSAFNAARAYQYTDNDDIVCRVIRDIFGNPFRSVAFDPAWRTSTALALASQMYDARDFAPMPLLADALQDAGCEDAAVLDHCRDPEGVHVRGCWVVDLLLGKS